MRCRYISLAFFIYIVQCQSVFALGLESLLLSPGGSLVALQERIGRMECAPGLDDGVEDCFAALSLGNSIHSTKQSSDVSIFLRARHGRVGQMVINGPAERLSKIFGTLLRSYGAPQQGISRAGSTIAPCTDLSQWQRFGHSVVVRVCRGPSGAGDFVVNVLADWYVSSRGSR